MSPSEHSGRVRGQTLLDAAHVTGWQHPIVSSITRRPVRCHSLPASHHSATGMSGGEGGGGSELSALLSSSSSAFLFFFSFEDVLCSFFLLLFEREV